MDTTFALLFLFDEDDPFSSFTSLLTVIVLVLRVVVLKFIRVVLKFRVIEEDVPFILTRLRLDPFSLLDQNIELPGNDLTDQPRRKAT